MGYTQNLLIVHLKKKTSNKQKDNNLIKKLYKIVTCISSYVKLYIYRISYDLRNKDAIGGRNLNIATQERKICDVEIEIVTTNINDTIYQT